MAKLFAALRSAFPPNRIAAIGGFLAGLSGLILGAVGAFPQPWQNGAVAIAGILVKGATILKFLSGSHLWDVLQAAQAGDVVAAVTTSGAATHVTVRPAASSPEDLADADELGDVSAGLPSDEEEDAAPPPPIDADDPAPATDQLAPGTGLAASGPEEPAGTFPPSPPRPSEAELEQARQTLARAGEGT